MEELKINFKVTDNVISDERGKSFFKYKYKPKEVQSQSTNMIVYDIETSNTEKVVPCGICISTLSKTSGKLYRDTTQREYEKRRNDFIVFKGTDCNINMIYHS